MKRSKSSLTKLLTKKIVPDKQKRQALSALLLLGSLYYLIGAIAHYFCLTIFPWYDGNLCSPYHDSLIAVASLAVSGFFYVTAINPQRMRMNLWVIIVVGMLVAWLTFLHAAVFDFVEIYGSNLKMMQAFHEGVLLLLLAVLILYLMQGLRRR